MVRKFRREEKELTGMDRIGRIKASLPSVLDPVHPVHPCLNLL
jgi:hypothetical protein